MKRPSLLVPFVVGIAAGLRAATPPAALALRSGRPIAGALLTLAAIGELGADKHPATPSRLDPGAAGGRLVSGALAGAFASGGRASLAGGVAGALGAVIGTRLGHALRTRAAKRLGHDWPVALVEDAAAIGLTAVALRK